MRIQDLLRSFKTAFSTIFHYFRKYPVITEKTDLCAYYRKRNKLFPTSFLMVILGIIVIQLMRLIESVFYGHSLLALFMTFSVFFTIDLALMIPALYCFSKVPELKSVPRKRDFSYHSTVRARMRNFTIIPTIIFTLSPLMVPKTAQSPDMIGISWLFCFVVQLHICTWVVDGIAYKSVFMGVFNVGYCWLSISKGFFSMKNGTKFTTPIILAMLFFVMFDRYVKENFILKRRIKQQKNMYERHLKESHDPIIILDNSKIIFSNAISNEKFARNLEEFSQNAAFTVTPQGESLKEEIERRLSNPTFTSEAVTQEKFYRYDDTSDTIVCNQTYNISIIESMSLSGEKIVSLAIHDLTEEARKEQSQVESKYKNMLLFSLSHELRTPLNIFQAFLRVTKSSVLSEDQLEMYKNAKGAWRYLRNKISDILDYAQILTGEFALHNSQFSLRKFTNKLQKVTSCLLGKKREAVQLKFAIDETIPDQFQGDRDRLEQVLFNFLSNAVKYTTSGAIELRIKREEEGKLIRFEVSDTGCGMTDEFVTSLFEIRGEDSNRNKDQSDEKKSSGLSGLGLTVSRMICNQMGSSIKVESVPSKGSSFSFTLPNHWSSYLISESAVPEDNPSIPLWPYKISEQSIKPKVKILVVDDTELNRFVVVSMIKKYGFDVTEAENGVDALNKVDLLLSSPEEYPEKMLIFMDLNMPEMDGIEATARIREKKIEPEPYIVALTAFSSESEREKCMKAGMNGFISKPLSKENLEDLFIKLGLLK